MFKKDFVWGVAASSFQIEGAANEDGKGKSIWDQYCDVPGNIFQGHTADVACDHYHRYKEDVAIVKQMGVKAYRFSVSWPRILPEGTGEVNQKGIDFYNALIDELIKNDIEPYLTLFHWDYPVELYYKGGWMNSDSPTWFEEYAKVIAENFSDRVKYFMTFNEPQCFIGLGHYVGRHAPGLKQSVSDTVRMSHHVLVAHGKAVKALRKYSKGPVKVGYAPTGSYGYPNDENSAADIEAARAETFSMKESEPNWSWSVTWWCDPVVFGKYPEDGLRLYGKYLPEGWEKDLETICQPLDFFGQNLYNGFEVKAGPDSKGVDVKRYEGFPRTAINWPITPNAIKWCAIFLYQRYNLPIYITENGMSCTDVISLDGKVHDPNRIDFLHRYLLALKEAADKGAVIDGYFQWSLMDNFEWGHGYNERFGLVFVDYPTQKRIIKDSGYWYKKVIESNGEIL